jgi:hypothetical protein
MQRVTPPERTSVMSLHQTVRAELVEALPFFGASEEEGQAFDKLRPNGVGLLTTHLSDRALALRRPPTAQNR